jgi:hypothetical protein
MRVPSSTHWSAVLSVLVFSRAAHAEHGVAAFPDEPSDTPAAAQPSAAAVRSPSAPPPTTAKSAPRPAETAELVGVSGQPTPSEMRRDQPAPHAHHAASEWLLSLDGVTHAPIDAGLQIGIETPQGLRLSGGIGWVPGAYMNFLTGIASRASGNAYAQALLDRAEYTGRTWRIQAGIRPFRGLGLYADVGYARLSAQGSLDLSATGVPLLAQLGGGYEASTRLDLWLVELGYQAELADRLVLGVALGAMGTFGATTRIASVNGAPTSSLLGTAATQADAALEKYGFTPTLTLRLGFDLI